MVTLYTSRLSYRGDDALDITRKSAGPRGIIFAPSWPLFRQYLARKHSRRVTRESWLESPGRAGVGDIDEARREVRRRARWVIR